MSQFTKFDIDYSKRCDVTVRLPGHSPFVMQIHGFTAAELNDRNGFLLTEVVEASLRRRGISCSGTISMNEARRVMLRGESGRPRQCR